MYWTLELASYLEDAPWPATKEELIDFAIRTGAPLEVVENLQDLEDEVLGLTTRIAKINDEINEIETDIRDITVLQDIFSKKLICLDKIGIMNNDS